MTKKNHCKILDPSDYEKWGIQHRKQWEVHMALDCLRDYGVAHEDAEILGVGAGKEKTIFHLSNDVKRVFATDLYMTPGVWADRAVPDMLRDVSLFADGITHNKRRIVAQHADMLDLPYEDDTFDAVFSSGSIEHVGGFEDVAQAITEIVRVVKPGGVISLSTEWRLDGDGHGWDGVLLFDSETLLQYIVEPSGCLYEGISSPAILDVEPYPLEDIVHTGRRPEVEMVLSNHGYVFTSVHIALVKPEKKKRRRRKSA